MKQVAGIDLESLRDPIAEALKKYEARSEGRLKFRAEEAAVLDLTPIKPNSARGPETVVEYLGREIGTKLLVIAFAPGDATGAEDPTRKLNDLGAILPYPLEAKVTPRDKSAVYEEAHFTVLTHSIDDVHAEPIQFGGTFDLVGVEGNVIRKIGELGHEADADESEIGPYVTLTTGYYLGPERMERFGDPHAVYNRLPDLLQVCAFLAINPADRQLNPGILSRLNPQRPRRPQAIVAK